MPDEKIPINEFRARTAEVLRTIRETGATYILTSRGEPVAEVVPYGTVVRRSGKPILGALAEEGWEWPWEEEGISRQAYLDRRRQERKQAEERRHQHLAAALGWAEEDEQPAQ